MSEYIAFWFGIVTGLACWCYYDVKENPYGKGYRDGYLRGKHEGKGE